MAKRSVELDDVDRDAICQCLDDRLDQLRMELRRVPEVRVVQRRDLESERDHLEILKRTICRGS